MNVAWVFYGTEIVNHEAYYTRSIKVLNNFAPKGDGQSQKETGSKGKRGSQKAKH
jgi:hypothetical protein